MRDYTPVYDVFVAQRLAEEDEIVEINFTELNNAG